DCGSWFPRLQRRARSRPDGGGGAPQIPLAAMDGYGIIRLARSKKVKQGRGDSGAAMSSLTDRIEAYLIHLLLHSKEGYVEVRRADVADRFACVPSQVTYVLATRFTPERGFFVESRRGGGGYIRIVARHSRPEPTGLG